MVATEAKSDFLAPLVSEVKSADNLHQTHFCCIHQLTTLMIAALERAHEELTEVKEQLVASGTGKAQALREFTSIKNFLDHILLVELFAASDDFEVEIAPLPSNWSDGLSGQLDIATHYKEIDRLRNELEASRNLNSKFAAELEGAKQEIAWLEADLDTAQNLTIELARAKNDIHILQGDLEVAHRLQETSSMELLEVQKEISRMRSQHVATSSALASAIISNSALQAELEDFRGLHETKLQNAKQERTALHSDYETTVSEYVNAKEEIRRLQGELTKGRESATMLKATEEVNKELQTKVEVVLGQYDSACAELSEATGQIEKLRAECESLRVKYKSSRTKIFHVKEEISRVEVEHLASQKDLMTDITIAQEENVKLKAEVTSSQAQIEDLKTCLYALRDSEAKAQESLVTTSSTLQKVRIELAIAKEALEWVGGDAAALPAELEAIRMQLPYCLTSLPHFVGSWMTELTLLAVC